MAETPNWGITLFDETTPVDALEVLPNAHANDLEAAMNAIAALNPTGNIKMWGTNTAPSGHLLCNGAAVSRTTYANLFTVLGTTYGAGDGSTTFNVPNFVGRVAVGRNSSDTDFDTLGETGGVKNVTLTVDQIPAHNHLFGGDDMMTTQGSYTKIGSFAYDAVSSPTGGGGNFLTKSLYEGSTARTGGQAHSNVQPYQVVNYIIKT